MRDRVRGWAGWALLAWAAVAQRGSLAGRRLAVWGRARRNAALHGAYSRGVPVSRMAPWLDLTDAYVRGLARAGRRADGEA